MKFVDHVFDDQVIDHLTLKIILPEGATYVILTVFTAPPLPLPSILPRGGEVCLVLNPEVTIRLKTSLEFRTVKVYHGCWLHNCCPFNALHNLWESDNIIYLEGLCF